MCVLARKILARRSPSSPTIGKMTETISTVFWALGGLSSGRSHLILNTGSSGGNGSEEAFDGGQATTLILDIYPISSPCWFLVGATCSPGWRSRHRRWHRCAEAVGLVSL